MRRGGVAPRETFLNSEQWYRRSLAIKEKGNKHGAALTYHELSLLAVEQQQCPEAGRLCLQVLTIYRKYDDPYNARIALRLFESIHESASPGDKRELEKLWTQAGLPLPATSRCASRMIVRRHSAVGTSRPLCRV